MSDYDRLSVKLLSAMTGELLPTTSWHDPERSEQRISIAVCDETDMTPDLWDKLSMDQRVPWLWKTLKALKKKPRPNVWIEGDDLPTYRPELAEGEDLSGAPNSQNKSAITSDTPAPAKAGLTAVEQAMVIYLRDPSQSVADVARQVPCNRSLLYRDERFKRLRSTCVGQVPKGSKTKDRTMEAESGGRKDE
jgi:hypothetical protein